MKNILALMMLASLLYNISAYGFEPTGPLKITGDRKLDETLDSLGYYASFDEEGFISDLSVTYEIPKKEIEDLVKAIYFVDAYVAIELSRLSNEPLSSIVKQYKPMHGKRWPEIMQRMGIKPGSNEFSLLEKGTSALLEKAKARKIVADDKRKKALKLLGIGEGSNKR